MRVLSLFDGMACGMLAMLESGIDVDRYVAFEIDKYAVQTSSHNFPMIEHRGDVFQADFTEFRGFDFLVGGSPCTYWSIAQKNNRETEASGMGWELFQQYVRALHEAQPMYFIYENNKSMSKAIRASIDKAFGFEAVGINSALVSAQNRQRLYWVGRRNADGTYSKVQVEQPEDRGILLKDVLARAECFRCTAEEKGFCLDSNYWKTPGSPETFLEGGHSRCNRSMAAEPVGTTRDGKAYCMTAGYANGSGEKIGNYAAHTLEKGCKSMAAEPVAQPFGETNGKAFALTSSYYKGESADRVLEKSQRTHAAEPVASTVFNINPSGKGINGAVGRIDAKSRCLTTNKGEGQKIIVPLRVGTWPNEAKNQDHDSQQYRIYSTDAKGVTLCGNGGGMGAKTGLYALDCRFACAVEWDEDGKPTKAVSGADGKTYTVYEVKDGQITIKGKQYPIKLPDGFYIIRKLTVNECKRLQTVPEWYEFPVSDTQAYKMLGNGWTVEVIAHLIRAAQEAELPDLFGMAVMS